MATGNCSSDPGFRSREELLIWPRALYRVTERSNGVPPEIGGAGVEVVNRYSADLVVRHQFQPAHLKGLNVIDARSFSLMDIAHDNPVSVSTTVASSRSIPLTPGTLTACQSSQVLT